MILEEIKNIKSGKGELKKFGLTFAVVCILLGCLFWWRGKDYCLHLFILSAIFLFLALLIPITLKPVYKVWMTIAVLMSWLITRIILSVLFYLVLTPIGLFLRLSHHNLLDLTYDKNMHSYWILREKRKFNKSDYEKQF